MTDPVHLFDGNIFYPTPLTLTLSDPVILRRSPSRRCSLRLGVHPVVAHKHPVHLGILAVGGGDLPARRAAHRLPARAAFIAGLTYACYAYRFEHYSHLELQMTQWMPLALLALHLFVSTERRRHAFRACRGAGGAATRRSYYAVFFVMYATAMRTGPGADPSAIDPQARGAARMGGSGRAGDLAAHHPRVHRREADQGERGRFEVSLPQRETRGLPARQPGIARSGIERLRPSLPERTLFPVRRRWCWRRLALAPPLGALRLVYARQACLVAFDGSLGLNGIV